ncbi:hypothetical protein WI40_17170 [Burkholderia ubonensis]|nr:hypothetical protein WI40_17170 [Burkholderia ubonensis]
MLNWVKRRRSAEVATALARASRAHQEVLRLTEHLRKMQADSEFLLRQLSIARELQSEREKDLETEVAQLDARPINALALLALSDCAAIGARAPDARRSRTRTEFRRTRSRIGRRKRPDGLPFRLYANYGKHKVSFGYKLPNGKWAFRLSAPARNKETIAEIRKQAIERAEALNGNAIEPGTLEALVARYFEWQEGLPTSDERPRSHSM